MRAGSVPGLRRIAQTLRPVDPGVVLFTSWGGKLADSPRAIFEELRRRDAPLEHVWVLDDPAAAPDGSIGVRPDSFDCLRALGRARYVVSNNPMPRYFRKRRGTTYVQTWHGAPLKLVGFDVEGNPTFDSYLRDLARDVQAWDYLVSPSRFSTETLRSAFRFEGEILETGYPRNDILFSAERDTVRARVREELGITAGQRAVLYAPTWRDSPTFSTELDMSALHDSLGDGFVLLIRSHSVVADTLSTPDLPNLRNVTARDDVRELLLAADVLVTDYSSVMFDFAATGKPIVLFAYDLEHYRDELRGLYFDLAAEAPGPLVRTTAELAEVLHDVAAARARYATEYERFRRRFCNLDDGNAAARVVDAVFG
jgi:CDP-glycerol glycerophosphotransferase